MNNLNKAAAPSGFPQAELLLCYMHKKEIDNLTKKYHGGFQNPLLIQLPCRKYWPMGASWDAHGNRLRGS